MDRATGTDQPTSERVCGCGGCGGDISDMPGAEFCGQGCHDSAAAAGQAGFGVWTEVFTELYHATTTGAPVAEVEHLAAAELTELPGLTGLGDVGDRGPR